MQRATLPLRIVFVAAAIAALGGCGGGIPSSPPLLAATGVQGLTQEAIEGGAIPLTPRPPVIRPLPGATVVLQTVHGQEVARQVSDSNGRFAFTLSPGTYVVGPARPDPNNALLPPASQTVRVVARHLTAVTLTYYSGNGNVAFIFWIRQDIPACGNPRDTTLPLPE